MHRASDGRVPTDVFVRALAISMVVFNHSAVVPDRPYELGGGLSALILLGGYAFARFNASFSAIQLRAYIRRFAVSFGVPCLILVVLSFAARRSFSWSELLFVHNFVTYSHIALFYNWYAEALLQLLALIYALTFWPGWVRAMQDHPWRTSLASTFVAFVLMMVIVDRWDPGNRLPHYLMWQFLFGWMIHYALQAHAENKWIKPVTLLLAVSFSFAAFQLVQPLRLPVFIGTTALLLYTSSVRVGNVAARLVSLVSQATLTIFLTHWLILQIFDRLHLRRFQSGFHLEDVLFAWTVAMTGGLGIWLLASSIARAWHYARRSGTDDPRAQQPTVGHGAEANVTLAPQAR